MDRGPQTDLINSVLINNNNNYLLIVPFFLPALEQITNFKSKNDFFSIIFKTFIIMAYHTSQNTVNCIPLYIDPKYPNFGVLNIIQKKYDFMTV